MAEQIKIPKRILSSLLLSLGAGVVPRVGTPYVAIGRDKEIAALLSDLETVDEGGSSMRFVIGKYGSGKSFLLQLMRGYALEKGFICADADLSPERRLSGSKGTGLATYRELVKNLSSKASPDGGALQSIISRWLSGLRSALASEGITPDAPSYRSEMSARIYALSRELEEMVGGFDFARILDLYCRAYLDGNDELQSCCMKWLRGEYPTKSEARRELGVGSIIDDDSWYDAIKLLAVFAKKTGYRGLVVMIDECVNLYKIPNRISRENNYEKILAIFNDTLQGRAPGLAVIMGGTPQFLEDPRRGLYSYEALYSRLNDGDFGGEYQNMMGPLIRLRRLSDNELLALINRITQLHSQNYSWEARVTDADVMDFLRSRLSRAGAETLITPREIIRDYITVLNILYQNPQASFAEVVGGVATTEVKEGDDDDIFSFEDIEL